jgi:hypothetical protein
MFEQVLAAWERLTLTKVLLGVLGGFSAIFLYWLYEQRNAVFITLTGSPFALLTTGAVVLLVVAAWVAYMFVADAERRNAQTLAAMTLRIDAADEYSRKQDREIARLHVVLTKTVLDERAACEKQIDQLVAVMNAHGIPVERRHEKERRQAHADDGEIA